MCGEIDYLSNANTFKTIKIRPILPSQARRRRLLAEGYGLVFVTN